MPSDVQEIYQQTILPLSEKERLKLAALIINDLSCQSAASSERPNRKGDIRKSFGMFNSGNPDSANNEQIDLDLAKAYADDHEDEK